MADAFDAVLAATALRDDRITVIVSADTAFASVLGVVHIDPASADFRDRLGIDAS